MFIVCINNFKQNIFFSFFSSVMWEILIFYFFKKITTVFLFFLFSILAASFYKVSFQKPKNG